MNHLDFAGLLPVIPVILLLWFVSIGTRVIKFLAEAEADRAARVGIANAIAIEEQVAAYGGPRYQLTQRVMDRFSEAIENSKVDVVPRIVVGGQKDGQGSGILDTLLTMLLSDKLESLTTSQQVKRTPETEALRQSIKDGVNNKPKTTVAS